jgi:hypothetical protein
VELTLAVGLHYWWLLGRTQNILSLGRLLLAQNLVKLQGHLSPGFLDWAYAELHITHYRPQPSAAG